MIVQMSHPLALCQIALDEHRAAEPAADADRRHAALAAGPLEHVQHVQHDARARRADRVADRDRAAVDVEPVLVERAHRARQAELASRQ